MQTIQVVSHRFSAARKCSGPVFAYNVVLHPDMAVSWLGELFLWLTTLILLSLFIKLILQLFAMSIHLFLILL